ncbi:MAG: transposase, partial [Xenococcaceae cyanobacterium MO_234.B1]|nr:transposase [Xenococcaceae cyanobacterium MO_234.B1]
MKYEPVKHDRRSIRLKGYDYTQAGLYFITICTYQKQSLLGAIANKQLILNDFGNLASECWQAIPKHFPRIELDKFIIMPNHIHGILIMTDNYFRGKAINRRGLAVPNP